MTKTIQLVTKNETQKQADRIESANDLRDMADRIEAGEINSALLVYEVDDITQLLPLLGDAKWSVFALMAAIGKVIQVSEEAAEE